MAKASVSVAHDLGQNEATERLREFLPRVREHYEGQITNLVETWDGNTLTFSFTVLGFQINGDLGVEESEVNFAGVLPLAAMMFRGKVEQSIREELMKLLS